MGGLLIFLLLLALVAGLIWIGYRLAHEKLFADRTDVDTQRKLLNAEWTVLENIRRVDDVFFNAGNAMRRAEGDRR